MKVVMMIVAMMFSSLALAQDPVEPTHVEVKCSWGKLTMESIADGFPQGPHSADPSGDGKGPGDADQPRQGLGNVVERGNLQATCEFIKSLL